MKRDIILASIATLIFTGCSTPFGSVDAPKPQSVSYEKPTPAKTEAFQKTMMQVALSTRDDSNYNKIALDTPEKKAWFKNLMYRLWDRQITRSQFIAEGLTRYPTREYEFRFVANGFQMRS